MFKKIEIWILYLTIIISIIFAVGFGVLVRQELVGNIKVGWVSKTALTLAEIPTNLKQILNIKETYDFAFKESLKEVSLEIDNDLSNKARSLYSELSKLLP